MQLRLGTRGSALARKQADIVSSLLHAHFPNMDINVVVIKTSGDLDQLSPLSQIGGKGVFIKELEAALIDRQIDIAVHSFKDITSSMPEALVLAGYLTPESRADVVILKPGLRFETLPPDSILATGSVRRQALLKQIAPHLKTIGIRGNVQNRLDKLAMMSEWSGIILSEAGLIRLGLEGRISHRFEPFLFYPAPGQGVIALQCRTGDAKSVRYCESVTDPTQKIISTVEFNFLKTVGFDCRLPLGLYTTLAGEEVHVKGFVANAHLSEAYEDRTHFQVGDNTAAAEFANRFLNWLRSRHDES